MDPSGSRNLVRIIKRKNDYCGTRALARNVPLQLDEVADTKKTYQWPEQAGLKDSIETLIMAKTGPEQRNKRHPTGPTGQQNILSSLWVKTMNPLINFISTTVSICSAHLSIHDSFSLKAAAY